MLSYGGGMIALIMTAPSVLFGAVGKATDWTQTGYADTKEAKEECKYRSICVCFWVVKDEQQLRKYNNKHEITAKYTEKKKDTFFEYFI